MSIQKTITAQTANSNTSFDNSMFEVLNLNDKYAESVDGDFYLYDALEIHGVKILHHSINPKGSCLELDNESPDFYSVYVQARRGGIECVGDFGKYELAKQYAEELSKKFEWRIADFVENTNTIFN
jgi:hypothetical protein